MATIQAELAEQEENIETQRTWLPAAHSGDITVSSQDCVLLLHAKLEGEDYYGEFPFALGECISTPPPPPLLPMLPPIPPPTPPSDGSCVDIQYWADAIGNTCEPYTRDVPTSCGWDADTVAYKGVSSHDACCLCGGGNDAGVTAPAGCTVLQAT
ncbi:hypothetical protein CYMTET_11675 [Cymbomonas tetramitiformis]|uniref:Uncharacterized protein n=1 Tax=Cymbomonas tetramitiformis TaxID=36881 RepID=A0AAE0LCX6_9CHLO|nr:hypothetical protein CYMTET_11675 [Cymbomonas tetramitiformis]